MGVMPKEQINYPYVPKADDPQKMDPAISVHWGGKGGQYVQLGIQCDIAWMREIVEGDWGNDPRFEFYSPSLSRDEINKLVRALRRSRDQSYGADA